MPFRRARIATLTLTVATALVTMATPRAAHADRTPTSSAGAAASSAGGRAGVRHDPVEKESPILVPGTTVAGDPKSLWVPGRPDPARKPGTIVLPSSVRTSGTARSVNDLYLPHQPQDPKSLIVVTGSGSTRSVVQALKDNGDFKALRQFQDGPNAALAGSPQALAKLRSDVPANAVARATELWGKGVNREVRVEEPLPPELAKIPANLRALMNVKPSTHVERVEGGPASKDPVVNQIYDNSGAVYGMFRSQMGRNSIDGKGMKLVSIAHVTEGGEPMDNAFWSDEAKAMHYGDGDGKNYRAFTELNIAGHELMHGVTANTGGLKYENQSGALNESFSDVMGMVVQQWRLGVRVDKADWRIGVAVANLASKTGGPIRSMSNPASVRHQPQHMAQYKLMPNDDDHDEGGVHTNSGIPNRAFYGAAMRLGGHVWEQAGKIWYVTMRDYIVPTTNFKQAARLTVHVAGELYGEGSREQLAVIAGWKDVGITVKTTDPLPALRGPAAPYAPPAADGGKQPPAPAPAH